MTGRIELVLTGIQRAANYRHPKLCDYLLQIGIDPNHRCDYGRYVARTRQSSKSADRAPVKLSLWLGYRVWAFAPGESLWTPCDS